MDPITVVTLATTLAKETGLADWLGRKLGGSKGVEIAGKVTDAAQSITGAKTPEEALAMIQANAEAAAELRNALLARAAEFDKMIFDDIKDARAMQQAALGQDDIFSKRYVYYLASFWSILTAGYVAAITFMAIPEQNVRFADTVLGFLLGTIVATIMTYFFGSSKGSHGKDSTMAELIAKLSDKD